MPIKDTRNYSLLTYCALKNSILALKIVVEHALSFGECNLNENRIIDWVNQKTDRGYTALHFAAFHGNVEMIKYLVETLKADIYA
jgi:ankyrin repeat protein